MRDDDFTDDDDQILEDDVAEDVPKIIPKASKAWRSIERYREMQELRKHLDDFPYENSVNDLTDIHW